MNDDLDQAADRAALAARNAVKEDARQSTTATSLLPIILVAAAVLSAVYLFTAGPADQPTPTDAMPVPHVQAPGTSPPPASPPPSPPNRN